jgi:flagellar assembly protein FliH
MSSKLIRGHDIAEGLLPWQAPEVSGPTLRSRGGELDDLRVTRQKAWQEGFDQGRVAGLEAANKDIAMRTRALEKALDALSRPFEELEHRFHEEILELVKAVARQLLRREMRLDPTHIVGVVKEGLAALPMAASEVIVRMHPDDAAAMRETMAPGSGERGWRLEADPLMDRGGCVIVTPQSQVDGRLETRIGRTIATMFEDERKDNSGNVGESPRSEPGQ